MSGDDVYIMDLSRPIEAHGEELTEIRIGDPDAKALKGISIAFGPDGVKLDMGALLQVISSAGGIPPSAAETIKMRDVLRHTKDLLVFFGIAIQ